VDDFATEDEAHYRQICRDLDLSPPAFDRAEILNFCGGHYRTNGLGAFENIPDESIEFSFSQAVLEHVRRDEFEHLMKALHRAHKPGSLSRHVVDLHDHLGGALNSFRFSPRFWENRFVQRAGFYTNRLSMAEMVHMAEKAGFRVIIERINPDPSGFRAGRYAGRAPECQADGLFRQQLSHGIYCTRRGFIRR